MPLGLRIFISGICMYLGVMMLKIGIEWLRVLFKKLSPKHKDDPWYYL